MKKDNKGVIIAALSAVSVASVAALAGVISKNVKKNLIKDLNDSNFKNFNGYGKCCSSDYPKDDSFDDVLRYRKGRYYQRVKYY